MDEQDRALLEEYKRILKGQRLYEEEEVLEEVTVVEDDILGTIITTSTKIPNPPSAKELRKIHGIDDDGSYDKLFIKKKPRL